MEPIIDQSGLSKKNCSPTTGHAHEQLRRLRGCCSTPSSGSAIPQAVGLRVNS